jgi:hypothetical protein
MPYYYAAFPNDKQAQLPRFHLITSDTAERDAFVAKHDIPGYALYWCPNPLKDGLPSEGSSRCLDNLERVERLFWDIDYKDLATTPEAVDDKLLQLPVEPTMVTDSGGGRHIYVDLKEPIEATDTEMLERVREAQRVMASCLSADPAPAHPAALMRWPGSHNSKRGDPVEVKTLWGSGQPSDITEWEAVIDLLPAEGIFERKQKPAANGHDKPNGLHRGPINVDERLASMRHEGPGASSVHQTELQTAASLLNSGMSVAMAVETILSATKAAVNDTTTWNWDLEEHKVRKQCYDWVNKKPNLSHALPEDLRLKFERAIIAGKQPKLVFRHGLGWHVRGFDTGPDLHVVGGTDAPQSEPPETNMFGWMLYDHTSIVTIDWIIKQLLPKQGILLLPGQWGLYKTTAAHSLSVCVMTGEPFAGQYKVNLQGGVMMFALEGAGMVNPRLRATATSVGRGNERLPFWYRDNCPPLTHAASAREIIDGVKAVSKVCEEQFGFPVRMIWIDTYSNAAGHTGSGDDNDRAATQKVFNTLRRITQETGILIGVIDHYGKVVEAGTTGSAGKEGNADAVLANLGDRENNGSLSNLRMVVRKQRDAVSGIELPFEPEVVELGLDGDGDPITAMALKFGEPRKVQAPKRKSPNDQIMEKAIDMALRSQGTLFTPDDTTGEQVLAVTEQAVRWAFYEMVPRGDRETDEQYGNKCATYFKRALTKAIAHGEVVRREAYMGDVLYRPEDLKSTH